MDARVVNRRTASGRSGLTRRPKPARGRPPAARVAAILAELDRLYPDAACALHHRSAWELLAATILSAQCTDERVNKVTPSLFARFPTIEAMANAAPREVESLIRSTGFFRNKARSLIGAARAIVERFAGNVPGTMDELLQLPGVARKTANVILGTWFRRNEGVVVDTHIGRLSQRLGLTWRSKDDKDARRIETDLMEVLPRAAWTRVGHALIWHGRRVCTARKPACADCTLAAHCPSAFAAASRESSAPRSRSVLKAAATAPRRPRSRPGRVRNTG